MVREKNAVIIIFVALMILLMFPQITRAEEGSGAVAERYDVKIGVDKNHVCHYEENISMNFTTPHHGVFRYIPIESRVYKIENIKVKGGAVKHSMDGSRHLVRVGDKERTITGKHNYRISYDLVYFKDDSDKEDWLSLDIFPPEWKTKVLNASVTLKLPFEVSKLKDLKFYEGSYGSNDTVQWFKTKSHGNTITAAGKNISPNCGLTVRSPLANGTWEGEPDGGRFTHIWIFGAILIVFSLLMKLLFGRQRRIVQTVEFYAPDGMTPPQVGTVIDGTCDDEDVAALIIYFASKGYLEIYEEDKRSFCLEKLKDIDEAEPRSSRTVFNEIFHDRDSYTFSKYEKNESLSKAFNRSKESAVKEVGTLYTNKTAHIKEIAKTIENTVFSRVSV